MKNTQDPNFSVIQEQSEKYIKKFHLKASSDIYSSDSSKQKKKKIKRKIKKRIFICPKCHCFPKIKFLKNNLLKVVCNCTKIINMTPRKFISVYKKRKNYNNNYFFCYNSNHEQEKFKIEFYCRDCRLNLCKKCAKNHHINHIRKLTPLKSEFINNKIKIIQQLIEEVEPNLDKEDSENRQYINIIITIINNYYDSLCYNQFYNVIKCEIYLRELKNKIQEIKMVETIKISKYKDFDDFEIFNNSHLIASIKLNSQKYIDLSKLKNFQFENLKTIQINNCDLKNLSGLNEINNIENIKHLDLEYNIIDDLNLKYIGNYKNIEFLNLYKNNLTNYEVFDFCQNNFKKLKTLYLGKNTFLVNKDYNKKYNFDELEILGITACFTYKTAHLISNIKCKNLKSLYISQSKLSTIKFMKNFDSENIIEFWADENDLKDISELGLLKFKKSLQIINLKKNKITEIKWLLENIKDFPNLKELNLIDNPLSSESKNIIEKIRKKTDYKLEIILDEESN